jgi:hypothetical protein
MGRILCNILVGGAALYWGTHGARCKLSVRGTCYRCCPVFVNTTTVAHSGAGVVVVDVTLVEEAIIPGLAIDSIEFYRSMDLVHRFFFNKIIPGKSHFSALCT